MTGSFVGTTYQGADDDETVTGTAENEVFHGEDGRDTLSGAGGDDFISGGLGSDILKGGEGNDYLEDGYGRDRLYGEAGDDTLSYEGDHHAGAPNFLDHGTDVFDGGAGHDELSVWLDGDETTRIEIDLASIKVNDRTLVTAKSMESLYLWISGGAAVRATGGDARDVVSTGLYDRGNDVVRTLAGDDVVFVGDGSDFVDAGKGDDSVFAYLGGRDTIRAGAGDDTLSLTTIYNGATPNGGALYDLGAGRDTFSLDETAGTTFDGTNVRLNGMLAGKVIGYEHMIFNGSNRSTTFGGTSRPDEIYMGYGDDTARGGNGDDVIQGGRGDDTLDGGAGRDTIDFSDKDADHGYAKPTLTITLRGGQTGTAVVRDGRYVETDRFKNFENVTGGDGSDTITGDSAANVLDGGLGNDILRGMSGTDTFVFSHAVIWSGPVDRTDVDRIVDFSVVHDSIRLSKDRFEALTGDTETGALDIGQFKDITTAATKLDADDRILYNRSTGRLYYDADGSGASAKIQFAILENHAAITADDVFIV